MIIEKTRPKSPLLFLWITHQYLQDKLSTDSLPQYALSTKLYNPHQYRLRQHLISKIKIVLSQTGRRQNMWTLQTLPISQVAAKYGSYVQLIRPLHACANPTFESFCQEIRHQFDCMCQHVKIILVYVYQLVSYHCCRRR
jgi:hypothetical protein